MMMLVFVMRNGEDSCDDDGEDSDSDGTLPVPKPMQYQ